MDKQRASDKTQIEEENVWNVDKETGNLEGIWKHCQSVQGCNEKDGQGPSLL